MSYNQSPERPVLLSSRETYEIYEKHSRPVTQTVIPSVPAHNTSYTSQLTQHSAVAPPRGASKVGQPFCGGPYVLPPKSNSPSVHFDDSIIEQQPVNGYSKGYNNNASNQSNIEFVEQSQPFQGFLTSFKRDGKFPIGWIVCISISVPIFVILVLFIAVWLQELGIL
uniref:Uncharacterized protein n=1 Tax=Panagrellus redivivus TaxID=6233 RepID=A0A7E4WCT7_PANRE